ncbi:hypothetical protein, partial [uncultured Porphyromonas sp.]|uniref:hypothetical protein n=1 Tax=uncultured Porphyromonas sp. TaxID=159274 RepID=UPI0026101A6C
PEEKSTELAKREKNFAFYLHVNLKSKGLLVSVDTGRASPRGKYRLSTWRQNILHVETIQNFGGIK